MAKTEEHTSLVMTLQIYRILSRPRPSLASWYMNRMCQDPKGSR